ncbi:MAG: S-methyl-5'-thioadenosine phosphorylase [Alphaproteobacteria bacterium]
MTDKLGFIGGSGIYNLEFLTNVKEHKLSSSFGNPSGSIIEGKINNDDVFFLSRHGKGHTLSPSSINYRANIDCLKQCGVTDLISLSAVGSLKENLKPGTFVIVDQFIDRTIIRKKSFFDQGIVAHVPMANPTSEPLMQLSKTILESLKINFSYGGTYLAMEGPQFSTFAESKLYIDWNCDVIGMTNMPEAKLAREAEIRYCSISMVTDYDCWHPEHDKVDLKMIIKTLNENVDSSKSFIKSFSKTYYEGISFDNDNTFNILDTSIITKREFWDKQLEKKLNYILRRYKKNNVS